MKTKYSFSTSLSAVLLLLAAPLAALADADAPVERKPGLDTAKIERGRYIVTTSGCHDCHTPWIETASGAEPDMTRMLSGHPATELITSTATLSMPWVVANSPTNTAFSGPWGVSFTANLTPDEETGLGKWTEKQFVQTIRTGRHKGRGREVLPPMPIPMYKHFTDDDLSAIFAFLRTIPPVSNKVPEPLAPTPVVADAQQN